MTVPRRAFTVRGLELVLALVGVLAALLIALDAGGPIRGLITLIAWSLLPGWAVLRYLRIDDGPTLLGLTVVTSVVITTVTSLTMVWTHTWIPTIVAVVLLSGCAASVIFQPVGGQPIEERRAASDRLAPDAAAAIPRGGVRPASALSYGLILVALALWAFALSRTQADGLGDWGLLGAFPVAWFVAVALVLGVCLTGLAARKIDGHMMAASLGALVLMLYASANLVEDAPRLPWVYKHIAVTRYIDTFGSVDPSIDLYHRWPGFFSFTALLGNTIGYHDPVSYAAWAELAFALIDVVLVLGIARAITSNPAVSWTAAIVFTICNWVGQSYFAPQAFAFTLYLAICLILVKYLRHGPRKPVLALERLLTRRRHRPSSAPGPVVAHADGENPRLRTAAIIAVLLLQAVVVASHQLTPYLILVTVLPLFLLGYIRPAWLGIAMLAMTVLYLLPNLGYVQEHFGLFSGFDPFGNATYRPPSDLSNDSTASMWQAKGVLALTALTVALAAGGFVGRVWAGHVRTTVIVAWFAVAPTLMLLAQTYGGEAKLRVFLFGLPWFAIGVAWLFWPTKIRNRRSIAASSIALTAMTLLFVASYFQPEADFRVPAADVVASEWIDQRVQSGDAVLTVVPTFPVLVGPHYQVLLGYGSVTALADIRQYYRAGGITAADIKAVLVADGIGKHQHRAYLVFSDSQDRYAAAHGLFDADDLRAVKESIGHDAEFVDAYDNGSVRIYEYR